ncbi:hypothetical protein TcasGA2_TC008850 [Tribolium castaneum]|uniref:Uncharacterized protein n=1 Tax=Tribolium castaneum TaxID=7070 RepID=D6WQU1_TRICA|nr:hypothetical protein TcasGA2_TC008850 [Tribolium castaneum]
MVYGAAISTLDFGFSIAQNVLFESRFRNGIVTAKGAILSAVPAPEPVFYRAFPPTAVRLPGTQSAFDALSWDLIATIPVHI